jgi:hypothetical protein
MILFVNVFISKNSATKYIKGLFKDVDRLSVFKYSMASLSVIKFSKMIIYAELDEFYADQREDLRNYLFSLFGNDLIFKDKRLCKQKEWQKAMEEEVFPFDDELVWFTCNDDHVFVDYDLDTLDNIVHDMKEMLKHREHVSCYFSHYPEMMCHVNYNVPYPVLNKSKYYFEVQWNNFDSIQIVSKSVLKHWWFAHDYGDDCYFVRTDGSFPTRGPEYRNIINDLEVRTLIPLRELCRHFDGYNRILGGIESSNINKCPPLFIPEGFFENNLKLSFCQELGSKELSSKEFVNINPFAKNYSCVSPVGADLKTDLSKIPLFWKNKIKNITWGFEIDEEVLRFAVNKSIIDLSQAEINFRRYSNTVPTSWVLDAHS